jgi:hypothetical protein
MRLPWADSELVRFHSTGRILTVRSYSFIEERVDGSFLFKVPQLVRTEIFATERFRSLVEDNGLTGLQFVSLNN